MAFDSAHTSRGRRLLAKAVPVLFIAIALALPATAAAFVQDANSDVSSGQSAAPASLTAAAPAPADDPVSRPSVMWLSVASDEGDYLAPNIVTAQEEPEASSGDVVIITIAVGESSYDIAKDVAVQVVATAYEREMAGADVLERFLNSFETGEQVSDDDILTIDVEALAEIDGGLAGIIGELQYTINQAAEQAAAEAAAAEAAAAEAAAAEAAAAEQAAAEAAAAEQKEDDGGESADKGDDEKKPSDEKASDDNKASSDKTASQGAAGAGELKNTEPAGPQTSGGTLADDFVPFSPNPTTREFIASIGEQSRKIAWDNDLYASVMIAQAILESGSGSSRLSKPPNNNLFGIKGSYQGESVSLPTQEDDGTGNCYTITAQFRKYPSTAESLQDYADLLTKTNAAYYAPARKSNAKTYVEACDYLQGHYATGTQYSRSLQSLITTYDLTQYDEPAPAKEEPKKAKSKVKTLKFKPIKTDERLLVASVGDGIFGAVSQIEAEEAPGAPLNLLILAFYLPAAAVAIVALFRACTKE